MALFLAGVILILVSLISLWIRHRRERFSIFKRNGIPGPEPSFWTGNFKEFIEKREACVQEFVKEYGNVVGFFLGAKPFVIVTDPELMKKIQVKEFTKFTDRDSILRDAGVPQPEFMEAMGLSYGEEWKKKRSLVSPSFSASRLRKLMPIINEAGDIFMETIESSSNEQCINIVQILKNLALDIITKSALGIDTGVQRHVNSSILDSTRLFLTTDTSEILPAISLLFPELEPIPSMLRHVIDSLKYFLGLPSVKTLSNHVRKIMTHRRKYSERREDVLQGLMDEKSDIRKLLSTKHDELTASLNGKENDKSEEKKQDIRSEQIALSDQSIVGTATSLVVAGFDTTSITLSYLAFYLAKYQEVQEKLREEINSQLKGKEDIGYEDLFKLPYMDQVISETLRLHATSMLTINRKVYEPYQYNGITIPKGVTIIIPSGYLQKNPDYWSEPDKFKPERFSPENKSQISPYVYQPFGHGPRNCVGMRFAQVVIKLILARLVRSYRIKSCNDKEVEKDHAIFIAQPKEVLVNLERISN